MEAFRIEAGDDARSVLDLSFGRVGPAFGRRAGSDLGDGTGGAFVGLSFELD